MDDVQWKTGTQVSFFIDDSKRRKQSACTSDTLRINTSFVWVMFHEKDKRGNTASCLLVYSSSEGKKKTNLNLVSCGVRLPSSASNFFPELLPWVYLRKAFKGCEFVLSIDVLFRQGNVFYTQFHLKGCIDWIILWEGGHQTQAESTAHENLILPPSPFASFALKKRLLHVKLTPANCIPSAEVAIATAFHSSNKTWCKLGDSNSQSFPGRHQRTNIFKTNVAAK